MADRRCGYCRAHGHNASKCELKLAQIEACRIHVGRQRKEISQLLTLNGFGVGALINAYTYAASDYVPCLVTQDSLDSIADINVVEFYNIKYSKRVSARLFSYNGITSAQERDSEIINIMRTSFYLKVTPMQNGLRDTHATIHISDLPIGPNGLKNEVRRDYVWERYAQLLAPSNDGSISDAALNRKFQIHPRLGDGFVTPLFP